MSEAWLPEWVDNDRGDASADFRFDEYLNLSECDRARLYRALESSLTAGRSRHPTAKAQDRYARILGCLAANAIIAIQRGSKTRVHYSRGKATYVGQSSPYHPAWLSSKLLREATDKLAAAGYLRTINGIAGPSAGNGWRRSTYEATPKLLALLHELGITADGVWKDEQASPVIFLVNEDGSLRSYDPSAKDVAEKSATLRAWNEQARNGEVSLELPADLAHTSGVQPKGSYLYRRFGPTLEDHGRFYGGWWQNLSKDQRAKIRIRKEQTVELDFQGLVARMLYHQEGQPYDGDPYAIPEIQAAAERDGLPWEDVRPVVKQIFNFMLNAKKRGGYDQSKAFEGLPPSISKKDAVAAIERLHAPIKHRFFRRQALRLMNQDARICEKILEAGLKDGILVLPIHDSFIVARPYEDWLREQMQASFKSELGFNPFIF